MASPARSRPVISQHQRPTQRLTRGQVARTLDELVEMGFIETFKDEANMTRYRPVYGKSARAGGKLRIA
jgi:DNA-binding MarR family transcriptional regulator